MIDRHRFPVEVIAHAVEALGEDVGRRSPGAMAWRAVDQDGFVLEVLIHSRRNTRAAGRLMRRL